ncbi:secreted salivary gland peptide, putative, partial [Ixodes scapularis]
IHEPVILCINSTGEDCEAQRPFTSCAPEVTPKLTYYYSNLTGQCEPDFGCGGGTNDFPSLEECKLYCPY